MRIEITLPIKLVSELNITEHWTIRSKRRRRIRLSLFLAFLPHKDTITLPCCVTLTRVSARSLDEDNLIGAFKSIRDYVADIIIPGLAMGRADVDNRINWIYMQEKGLPKEYRCKIVIQSKE